MKQLLGRGRYVAGCAYCSSLFYDYWTCFVSVHGQISCNKVYYDLDGWGEVDVAYLIVCCSLRIVASHDVARPSTENVYCHLQYTSRGSSPASHKQENKIDKKSILFSWLGIWFVVQPLPQEEDEQDLQQSTQEIRVLLDDTNEQEPKSC